MANVTLGVQLIVKDEAERLPHCLRSLQGADEIVIVDTGSSDDSIAIAQAHGAKVFQWIWAQDFSAARNEALSHAETDWILVLDADECLQTPLTELKKLIQDTKFQALTVNIDNLVGANPEDRVQHRPVRLFRNRQGYLFNGRVHEGVDASIINKYGTASIGSSEIEIIHFGYLPDIMKQKRKVIRNEELLRLALAEQPDDHFYSYNLAVTCCQDDRLDEAQTLLLHTIDRAPLQVSYRPAMIRDLCKIYLSQGNMKSIDSLLSHELDRYSDYPDLHYIQGQSLESQGQLERAFLSYQRAESISEHNIQHREYVSEKGIASFRPLTRMGEISQQLGLHEDAARLFHQALQHHSLYTPALLGIASAFQHLQVPDEQIGVLLIQLVTPNTSAGRSAIISTLYEVDAYETIAGLSLETFPLEQSTAIQITSALIVSDRLHEANVLMQENMSRLTDDLESSDLEYSKHLWTLWAICQWRLYGVLQEDLLIHAPDELHFELQYINQCLQQEEVSYITKEKELNFLPFLTDLIKRSVKLIQLELAQKLVDILPDLKSILAAALYEEGHTIAAGEYFISLVHDKLAKGKILFYIGEMIFDKGHYSEASAWFQQAMEQEPTHEAASVGLSLCYLQLAKLSIEEVLDGLTEDHVHGPLQEDIRAINKAISLLNRTPWHTHWSFHQSQRRNAI